MRFKIEMRRSITDPVERARRLAAAFAFFEMPAKNETAAPGLQARGATTGSSAPTGRAKQRKDNTDV